MVSGLLWWGATEKEINMIITRFDTIPSQPDAHALDKSDENARGPLEIETFPAPDDDKIADFIFILLLIYLAFLWWM